MVLRWKLCRFSCWTVDESTNHRAASTRVAVAKGRRFVRPATPHTSFTVARQIVRPFSAAFTFAQWPTEIFARETEIHFFPRGRPDIASNVADQVRSASKIPSSSKWVSETVRPNGVDDPTLAITVSHIVRWDLPFPRDSVDFASR